MYLYTPSAHTHTTSSKNLVNAGDSVCVCVCQGGGEWVYTSGEWASGEFPTDIPSVIHTQLLNVLCSILMCDYPDPPTIPLGEVPLASF